VGFDVWHIGCFSVNIETGVILMEKATVSYKRTTISLPDHEYEILRYLAFKQKTSVAGVIRTLISQQLEDQEDIRDGRLALQERSAGQDWQTFKKELPGL
jgi:hypothetical protein